jgi:pyridoxal 5''-phosphate synthase, glutaminase subunit Pdx2
MRIGVLALQGAFYEHINALNKLGTDSFEIRKKSDLESGKLDGLILPGGESTVIGKLLRETGLFEPLKTLIENGLPVLGTCAGLILLANKIENDDIVWFGSINISAKRNAFGRQLGSFSTEEEFEGIGNIPMTFIRAPYISKVGDGVKILSRINGHIVAAEQKNVIVTAFHPELTDNLLVHRYFLEKCLK